MRGEGGDKPRPYGVTINTAVRWVRRDGVTINTAVRWVRRDGVTINTRNQGWHPVGHRAFTGGGVPNSISRTVFMISSGSLQSGLR